MNIKEFQADIEEHKQKLGKHYNSALETSLPFFIFHQQFSKAIKTIEEKQHGLSSSEVDVLVTILVSGDNEYKITPTLLYKKLLYTSGAITKVLKKLEDKGLIIRLDNISDNRSTLVQLTLSGKEKVQTVLDDVLSYEEKCFSVLTDEELSTFQKLLIKLAEKM